MTLEFSPAGTSPLAQRLTYALSIKQPWAALVVSGRKTIEVRTWPTSVRGRVLIHAGRSADDREQGWSRVDDALRPIAELRGGVIGSVEISGCVLYREQSAFVADCPKHLNDPDWFAPNLYGFEMRHATILPFFPCKGWFKFFQVPLPEAP